MNQTNTYVTFIDKTKPTKTPVAPAKFDTFKPKKKQELMLSAYNKIEGLKHDTNPYYRLLWPESICLSGLPYLKKR